MKIRDIWVCVLGVLALCSCGTSSPNVQNDSKESAKLIIHFNTSGLYLNGDAVVSLIGGNKLFSLPVDSYNNVVTNIRVGDYNKAKIEVRQKNSEAVVLGFPFNNIQEGHTYRIDIDYNNGRFNIEKHTDIHSPLVTYLANVVVDSNSPYKVDSRPTPTKLGDMSLVWCDEFNTPENESFDKNKWSTEEGFIRNEELQWYQADNAKTDGQGNIVLQARREKVDNPNYNTPVNKQSDKWKVERKEAEYTSASINTKDKFWFTYGTMLVRAKIPTSMGCWPAIWTLGDKPKVGSWPACGEIDVMEYYRKNNIPGVLANTAFASDKASYGIWDTTFTPLSKFTTVDKDWASKYHIWRMDWNEKFIRIYLDGVLLNETNLSNTINGKNGGKGGEGINPFHHKQYILLNLAIGQNGGDPSSTHFPQNYYIDYVRVYQRK